MDIPGACTAYIILLFVSHFHRSNDYLTRPFSLPAFFNNLVIIIQTVNKNLVKYHIPLSFQPQRTPSVMDAHCCQTGEQFLMLDTHVDCPSLTRNVCDVCWMRKIHRNGS